VFPSLYQEKKLSAKLEKLKSDFQREKDEDKQKEIKKKICEVSAELFCISAKSESEFLNFNSEPKPCYFNTGCCSYSDGDITGIEIDDGEIRLVRWSDTNGKPKRDILRSANLKEVLENC